MLKLEFINDHFFKMDFSNALTYLVITVEAWQCKISHLMMIVEYYSLTDTVMDQMVIN